MKTMMIAIVVMVTGIVAIGAWGINWEGIGDPPEATATPMPTSTPEPSPTPLPTPMPGPTETPVPTSTPFPTLTLTPMLTPTATPISQGEAEAIREAIGGPESCHLPTRRIPDYCIFKARFDLADSFGRKLNGVKGRASSLDRIECMFNGIQCIGGWASSGLRLALQVHEPYIRARNDLAAALKEFHRAYYDSKICEKDQEGNTTRCLETVDEALDDPKYEGVRALLRSKVKAVRDAWKAFKVEHRALYQIHGMDR